MYITILASRDAELVEVIMDFKKVHDEDIDDLDTVISKIEEI